MKTLKKYAYQSPETEVLSLETKQRILNDSPAGGGGGPGGTGSGDPDASQGGFGAPWRF